MLDNMSVDTLHQAVKLTAKRSELEGQNVITLDADLLLATTNEQTTCRWCAVNCKRAFIDVKVPGGKGRPKSKIPVGEGWERVITGNSCTRGLIEDATEYRERLADITEAKNAHPNTAERVREDAFR